MTMILYHVGHTDRIVYAGHSEGNGGCEFGRRKRIEFVEFRSRVVCCFHVTIVPSRRVRQIITVFVVYSLRFTTDIRETTLKRYFFKFFLLKSIPMPFSVLIKIVFGRYRYSQIVAVYKRDEKKRNLNNEMAPVQSII